MAKSRVRSFAFPSDIDQWLIAKADRNNITVSEQVRRVLLFVMHDEIELSATEDLVSLSDYDFRQLDLLEEDEAILEYIRDSDD